ncbi:MAG: outer membrane lipoprotein carrier protein LolA [Candidatus Electryonea clarkiae]|nr:outer membrane lipoprotein carrier protein LolA [Candidatus Electryonea clarkiae]MDP8288115.1 outer membrane lipoprotein carrier protein LolA [Candidatus Electryonea clarkiae]
MKSTYPLFRRVIEFVLLFALFFLSGRKCLAEVPDSKKLAADIRQKYEAIETFSATYRLEYAWMQADRTNVEEGTIEYAKGDRFKLQLGTQVIISDGKSLWRYSKDNKQVIIENLKDVNKEILPSNIIFNYLNMFSIESISETVYDENPVFHLKLKSADKSSPNAITNACIGANDLILRKLERVDESGNKTAIYLSDIKVNHAIADDTFTFQIPEDITIHDLR